MAIRSTIIGFITQFWMGYYLIEGIDRHNGALVSCLTEYAARRVYGAYNFRRGLGASIHKLIPNRDRVESRPVPISRIDDFLQIRLNVVDIIQPGKDHHVILSSSIGNRLSLIAVYSINAHKGEFS